MRLKLLSTLIAMLSFLNSVRASGQDSMHRYLLRELTITYRIPKELEASYTHVQERFEDYTDRVIYTTSFTSRGFFSEKSTGNFTIAIIAMPSKLRDEHSVANMGEYFRTSVDPAIEVATAVNYQTVGGEWAKIERRPVTATSKVSGILYYRILSEQDILFVGLGTQAGDSWPPHLLKKLLPSVQKVVESIEVNKNSVK